ncbi:AIM24 family protein [Paenibacillus thermoaerophilus]|uniref:AIM24 family protein n=1 Tax=Paenibacillus thermoaerophilus TaxID=1215385 RepID=A0ABW2V6I7_9BACL|nr:AIM24 family protein [Paenibacillus thermoaerophilus]TMV17663.1 hypothetical protein FE781_05895 [Paenibacillus thermoaerophilus]
MNLIYHSQSSAAGEAGQAVEIGLDDAETLHVLHPDQLVAYQGPPAGRQDSLFDLPGLLRKKKLIRTRLTGPGRLWLALPPGFHLTSLPVGECEDLLFEYRNVLYYTEGIGMKTVWQQAKRSLLTRELVKMKFDGTGTIGLLTSGPLVPIALDPQTPLFADAGSLVAFPENARVELAVYGNHLASQHMRYQWKLTGRGYALLQAGRIDRRFEREFEQDGLLKRVLREVVPFGGVWFR